MKNENFQFTSPMLHNKPQKGVLKQCYLTPKHQNLFPFYSPHSPLLKHPFTPSLHLLFFALFARPPTSLRMNNQNQNVKLLFGTFSRSKTSTKNQHQATMDSFYGTTISNTYEEEFEECIFQTQNAFNVISFLHNFLVLLDKTMLQ